MQTLEWSSSSNPRSQSRFGQKNVITCRYSKSLFQSLVMDPEMQQTTVTRCSGTKPVSNSCLDTFYKMFLNFKNLKIWRRRATIFVLHSGWVSFDRNLNLMKKRAKQKPLRGAKAGSVFFSSFLTFATDPWFCTTASDFAKSLISDISGNTKTRFTAG